MKFLADENFKTIFCAVSGGCWGYFANLRDNSGLTQLVGSHDAVHQAPEMRRFGCGNLFQEPRTHVEGRRFAQLLRNPVVRWVACDRKMDDAARTQFNDEKDKKRAKPDIVTLEEIARPDLVTMILEKTAPRLTGSSR